MNNPVSGSTMFVFTLYDAATAGATVWTETQTITLDSGFFSAQLGETTPIPPATFATAAQTGKTLYLGIKVNADPELSPRQPLLSVPYALVASNAIGDITPHTVSVAGKTVIDATGAWVGASMGGAGVMTSGTTPAAGAGVALTAGFNKNFLYPVTNFNVASATHCSISATAEYCGAPATINGSAATASVAFRPTGGADPTAFIGYPAYAGTLDSSAPFPSTCVSAVQTYVVGVTPNTAYDFGCNMLTLVAIPAASGGNAYGGYCGAAVVCF
jgi:hypothetical protein